MKKQSLVDWVAIVFVYIGALNWGLVSVFKFNVVEFIFGPATAISQVVYIVIGLAALYLILVSGKMCGCYGKPVKS